MFHFPTIQTSFGLRINENLFEAHLLTKCAYSECEPQGGEIASAELDGQYKRLRRVVAKLAHKAQWHNNGTILIYASAECVPTRSGRRGFPFKGERRYGRDALSNTSCECVVAKANEADCSANAEVQTREERGKCN